MKETKIQTFKGKEFKVVRGSTHPDYSYHTFEREETDFRDQYWNIKADDVVFDIGASYGSYTLTACAMGATVYTFEPEKTVFDDLIDNIIINNYNSICYPMNIGLWSSKAIVNMKDYAPHWPAFSITSPYQVSTIDQVAKDKKVNKIDWMKIDVEGAEEHVIKGGLETIKKFHPKLIVECHIFLDQNLLNNVKTLLSVCDYNFEEISRPPCVMLYATSKNSISSINIRS